MFGNEGQDVAMQAIGMRDRQSMAGTFVDPEHAAAYQVVRWPPGEIDPRRHIGVAVDDQGRNSGQTVRRSSVAP